MEFLKSAKIWFDYIPSYSLVKQEDLICIYKNSKLKS